MLAIEKLYIIIGPKQTLKKEKKNEDNNEELGEQHELRDKSEKLTMLEAKWFKEVELLGVDDELSSSTNRMDRKSKLFALLSPIIYSLLNNIQISLNSLHIRYEDPVNKFSFDVRLGSLLVKNDDADSSRQTNSENLLHKKIELNNFSIFSTTNKIILNNENCMDQDLEVVKEIDELNNFKTDLNMVYLIEPTSFQAQVTRDLSPKPLRKSKKPRIRIYTLLIDFNLNVNELQMKYLTYVIKFTNIYKNMLKCSKIKRPERHFFSNHLVTENGKK
jgi:hypothetical protein